jgi:hypothetical protein
MSRISSAWRQLEAERRLAAAAALGLFVSMFLPWYSKTDTLVVQGAARSTQTSLNAFQAFSFVEAAVLLVSGGVLVLLFKRAEGGEFRVPGGDGTIVLVAGAWAALLVFYRLLDKPGLQGNERLTATVGVEWGIFIALLLALTLAYAGGRMRSAARPAAPLVRRGSRARPPAPDRVEPFAEDLEPFAAARTQAPTAATRPAPATPAARREPGPAARREPGAAPRRRSAPVAARERASHPPEQLSFEDPPERQR